MDMFGLCKALEYLSVELYSRYLTKPDPYKMIILLTKIEDYLNNQYWKNLYLYKLMKLHYYIYVCLNYQK